MFMRLFASVLGGQSATPDSKNYVECKWRMMPLGIATIYAPHMPTFSEKWWAPRYSSNVD
jgi:hypothetical protein